MNQRGGQTESLRHALRKLSHTHVDPLRDAQFFEKLAGASCDRGAVQPRHPAENRERLAGSQVARNLMSLRKIADTAATLRIPYRQACHARGAGGRPSESEKNLDCRGLAGAVRTQESEELTLTNREVDAVECRNAPPQCGAVDLAKSGDLDDRH